MNVTLLPPNRFVQLLLAVAAPTAAHAQLCVFLTGPSYLEDFNTLPASGTSNNPTRFPKVGPSAKPGLEAPSHTGR